MKLAKDSGSKPKFRLLQPWFIFMPKDIDFNGGYFKNLVLNIIVLSLLVIEKQKFKHSVNFWNHTVLRATVYDIYYKIVGLEKKMKNLWNKTCFSIVCNEFKNSNDYYRLLLNILLQSASVSRLFQTNKFFS